MGYTLTPSPFYVLQPCYGPPFLAIAGPSGLYDRLSEWLTRPRYDDLGYVLDRLTKL